MRLTIATVYHPLPLHPPADIIKNFDAKNWRPIIRATQLAFGMPKSRHQVSAQPVQIARMKYSFEIVPLPSPANHDGNERKREGKKGVDRRAMSTCLFICLSRKPRVVWGGQTDLMGKESAKREEKGEKWKKGYRLDESEWTNSTLLPSLLLFSFVVFLFTPFVQPPLSLSLSIYLSISSIESGRVGVLLIIKVLCRGCW